MGLASYPISQTCISIKGHGSTALHQHTVYGCISCPIIYDLLPFDTTAYGSVQGHEQQGIALWHL